MKLEIKDNVLLSWQCEEGDKELDIPEGVKEIKCQHLGGVKRIVLPRTLRHFEADMHKTVAFTKEYSNQTLVLYGQEIDLTDIFLKNCRNYDAGDYTSDRMDEDPKYDPADFDKHAFNDYAYEYYNKKEAVIIDGVVAELNQLLARKRQVPISALWNL